MTMISFTSILTSFLIVAGVAVAKPLPKTAEQPVVTYLGTQGPILCKLHVWKTVQLILNFHSEWRLDVQVNCLYLRNGTDVQWVHCHWWN